MKLENKKSKRVELVERNFFGHDPKIENDWNRILNRLGISCLSMTYEWFKSKSMACLAHSRPARYLELTDPADSKVVGIIPFQIKFEFMFRYFRVKTIRPMRLHDEPGDHYDLLIDPDYFDLSLKELYKWFGAKNITMVILNNMRSDSKVFNSLHRQDSKEYFSGQSMMAPTRCISIPGNESFIQWKTKKFKRVERYRRSLLRDMDVSYRTVVGDDELEVVLKQYKKLHEKRFQGKGQVSSIVSNPMMMEFLERLARYTLKKGTLMVNYLNSNQDILAIDISFRVMNRIYSYTSAFDENYSKYRVGSIHMLYLVEAAFSNEMESIDLLQGNQKYKSYWSNDHFLDINCTLFSKSFYGYALFMMTKMIPRLKNLLNFGNDTPTVQST